MKTAICIDNWKRTEFERGLMDSGFSFDTKPFTKDGKTLVIFVEFDEADLSKLADLVADLQSRCARKKRSQN